MDEHLGREIESVLRSGQLPPGEVISTTLINDILELERRFVLVVDDFQVIQDRAILQVLEKVVTTLPQPLHMVLITREDPVLPLARLRANNQMTEIRAEDLRFTDLEASRFLNDLMDLSLSQEDIAALEDRTEGWIVGLQLAGLSIQKRADPSSFIATLSGSHRYILSYLTEEVVSRQPEDIQRFMLETSILDKLSGDLCDAVTGRTDSGVLLEKLFAANLFLIPLDDERRWYRYHHLFTDLLRDLQKALRDDEKVALHQRASHWYADAGMANEAVQHALDAADYAAAVQLIENHAMDMIMQWHAKTVNAWMQALPPQWSAQSPKTNMAFAWMHLLSGTYAQAIPYLERLQTMFASSPIGENDMAVKAGWLALQSNLLNGQGKPAESLALAQQALEIVPEEDSYLRSLIYLGLVGAYQQMDDYARSVEAYQMIIRHGRAAGNFVSEMLGISGLALMVLEHGQLHLAFEMASQGIDLIERVGLLPPISAAVYGELGQLYYQWHQLEQAHHYFRRAVEVSALSGYSDAEIYYGVIRSRLLQTRGDLESAAREIQKTVDLAQTVAPAAVREEVVAQQVRVYLAQNRLVAADAVLQQHGFTVQDELSIPDIAPGQHLTYSVGLLYNCVLRVLLYQAQVKPEQATWRDGIDLADRLFAEALRSQRLPLALEALLLRAQLHAVSGNNQARLDDCARALELAAPEGFISVFIDEGPSIADALTTLLKHNRLRGVEPGYVKNLLAVFSETVTPKDSSNSTAAAAQEMIDPLSKRELEILQLIGVGCSNQEIAERLVITLHTVKKHSSNIFSKLQVNSRTQAIARAHQLGLL
ncbi:MAG TPA: LuxR C-terminal-related transcriptional regulator [Aggregatilineaceae bacterium]|nr:LuxR C-terminal-related transcriptional regulator [Aggregatilineaceae bacterium]